MGQRYDEHSGHHHDGEIPCGEIARKVYQFIEGQLDIGELEKFKEHISLCLPCQDIVRFEQKLIEVIHAKGGSNGKDRVSLPNSLAEKIRRAMGLSVPAISK